MSPPLLFLIAPSAAKLNSFDFPAKGPTSEQAPRFCRPGAETTEQGVERDDVFSSGSQGRRDSISLSREVQPNPRGLLATAPRTSKATKKARAISRVAL